ncbi:unnamed protein product [Gongylonema pulchrum]|uniref:RGS domain-containing protein n=1 Tax=Gongylonema pulchrum TaxID=637853 RepID=A0A3P6RWZ4_9BILA|nr:unnamed protein product [Gongylonema pulchrum]
MIRDREGRLQFTKFLESEYSEENILWAVEELHAVDPSDVHLLDTVHEIYSKFVAADSSLAINIDHDTRAEILEHIERPSRNNANVLHIFDKAQAHVYRWEFRHSLGSLCNTSSS